MSMRTMQERPRGGHSEPEVCVGSTNKSKCTLFLPSSSPALQASLVLFSVQLPAPLGHPMDAPPPRINYPQTLSPLHFFPLSASYNFSRSSFNMSNFNFVWYCWELRVGNLLLSSILLWKVVLKMVARLTLRNIWDLDTGILKENNWNFLSNQVLNWAYPTSSFKGRFFQITLSRR